MQQQMTTITGESSAETRRISRADFLHDYAPEFMDAVAGEIDKIFNDPEDSLHAEETIRQQKVNRIRTGRDLDLDPWDNDQDYAKVYTYLDFADRHDDRQKVALWFNACIEASKIDWVYKDDSASIEIEAVAEFWTVMPIPQGVNLSFDGSTSFSHAEIRHLIWDWFHPVVPLTTVRALGKKLAAWSLQANDAIARLAAVLCEGQKKPPVRFVWEVLPLLKQQQGAVQFSLLGKPKNPDQLDALVEQLEEYCTPP